jgi:hypothetical protein
LYQDAVAVAMPEDSWKASPISWRAGACSRAQLRQTRQSQARVSQPGFLAWYLGWWWTRAIAASGMASVET